MFYNILFLKSHCEAIPTKGCKMLKLPVGKCSSAFWSCLSFESSVGDCSTLWMLAVSLQGGGRQLCHSGLASPPEPSLAFPGQDRPVLSGGTPQKQGSVTQIRSQQHKMTFAGGTGPGCDSTTGKQNSKDSSGETGRGQPEKWKRCDRSSGSKGYQHILD